MLIQYKWHPKTSIAVKVDIFSFIFQSSFKVNYPTPLWGGVVHGVVDFNTEDHKLLEYIAAIFETFSINYDNVDSLMEGEMCYQCDGSCGYHHFTNFDDLEELEDYVNKYYKLNSKSLSLLKKYFNKPKIYAFLILDDNLFIIDIKSAQNALEYFRDNYDDEDENE